jgi:hypothetical protein
MWLQELGARERAVDNYAVGDLVLEGRALSQAEAEVADRRKARCEANQAKLMAASTAAKRIKAVKDLLNNLWEGLESRPECQLQNMASQVAGTADMDTTVGRLIEEAVGRQTRLREAGVDQTTHPHVHFPNQSFVELQGRALHAEVARLRAGVGRSIDGAPPLEAVD